MNAETDQACRAAWALLQEGRAAEAVALMRPAAANTRSHANAQRMLGLALAALGELAEAENQLRAALALNDRSARVHGELADILLRSGQNEAAVAATRVALAQDPAMRDAVLEMARQLIANGRAPDADTILGALDDDVTALSMRGEALRAQARFDAAASVIERAAAQPDASPAIQHNLADTLVFAERYAEAEAAAARAIDRGMRSPETLRVRGRALQGLGRFEEAEASYRAALSAQPDFAAAHRDLAQLIWMRSGEASAATAILDAAIRTFSANPYLRIVKAKLLEFAGDRQGGVEALAPLLAQSEAHPHLDVTAAQLLMPTDAASALRHAERALRSAPTDMLVLATLAEANLAAGRPEAAVEIAGRIHAFAPHEQHAIALMATAWRLLGDPRYHALYDYAAFVRPYRLDAPTGWRSVDAWLDDFQSALTEMHGLQAHPIGQSLRGGTQAQASLERSEHPAVRAFFEAIDGPIRRHIEFLGGGEDVLRARSTGRYRIAGSWSVRLRPGGAHVSHIHPAGWLSSACYISLPEAVEHGKQGWLAFGEPGIATSPPLAAEHWIKPERGMVVLFPSYMWHGTIPFTGDQPRLTCAFDVVPG